MNKEVIDLLEEVLTMEQIEWLQRNNYFTAPASSKYHLCKEGGLAEHSLNVCKTMFKLNDGLNLGLKRKDIIQSSLLHDLDKIYYYDTNYLKSGNVSEKIPYKYNPKLILPHGLGAIYLISNELKVELAPCIATAISYHMGAFNEDFRRDVNKLSEQPYDMILTWCLQSADMFATQITEKVWAEIE